MTLDLALLLTRRALVLWALVHLLALVTGAVAQIPPEETLGVAPVALVAVVFAIDLARRGERTLLANLGVGLPAVLGIALLVAAAAESALAAAVR